MIRDFHKWMENKAMVGSQPAQPECPRCAMIEKRADVNIHLAKLEAQHAVQNFCSELGDELQYLFVDIRGPVPNEVDSATGRVLFTRMIQAKEKLTKAGVLRG